ncbi:MAG: hypothetical protein E7157_04565 [Lactobacillales bacterium]|nr:hypothetical protein [Lactobacillales bacterium]
MIKLEDVFRAIDSNNNIDSEVKENIKELINIFNSTFPNVDLSNFTKRIMDLKIEKSNKFINKRVVKYNFKTNILEFNVDEINKGYDMKHILMHGLLNVISSNDVQTGFNYNDKFKALNAGYTEILTNNLVGNDGELSYLDDEVVSTNLIATMIGNDVLFESYFNNDTNKLVSALINEGVEV